MKRYVIAGAAVLTLALTVSPVADAMSSPQPPQSAVSQGTPCPPAVGSATGGMPTLVPRPCSPETKPPGKPPDPVKPGQAPKVAAPATPAEAVKMEKLRRPKDEVDDWAQEQVDKPLGAMRGFFETTMLVQPGLLQPNQGWVLTSWGSLLLIGLVIALLAWLNHARHVFQGTDHRTGQNPLIRLGIPGACIIMMLLAPAAWELSQVIQDAIWETNDFDRRNADDVLAVVLPPAPVVNDDGTVSYMPAGSIAPVQAKVGTGLGVGYGLAILVLGGLGALAYFIGRLLVILGPLWLSITAFSHNLAPTVGWLDLFFRTSLLTSVFNAGWVIMRHLPTWMTWTLVDAVVFVLLVLPVIIGFIYLFWFQRLSLLFTDFFGLGGASIMARVGLFAGGFGRTLATAGSVMGATKMAAVGGHMQSWAQRTSELATDVARQAERGSAAGVIRNLVPARLRGLTPPRVPSDGTGHSEAVCWQDGDQYVHYVHGVPTWSPSRPEGTQVAGTWRGE